MNQTVKIPLLTLCALTLIAGAFYLTVWAPALGVSEPTETLAAQTYEPEVQLRQDQAVVELMKRWQLDYSGLNLVYGQNPNMPDNNYASFSSPNTIYLSPDFDTTKGNIDMAINHEYMHYVQYTLGVEEARSHYPYMKTLTAQNGWLYDRLARYREPTYTCDGGCIGIEGEAQAYACTEMNDYRLTADFVAFCNKYLPLRSSLL